MSGSTGSKRNNKGRSKGKIAGASEDEQVAAQIAVRRDKYGYRSDYDIVEDGDWDSEWHWQPPRLEDDPNYEGDRPYWL